MLRGQAFMPPSPSTGRGSSRRGLFQEMLVILGWPSGIVLTPWNCRFQLLNKAMVSHILVPDSGVERFHPVEFIGQ